jgi:hypothetical protein
LERERNEAQEKYATEATEHMLAVNKICNERDEALSQIAQAECRAERFCQERDEARSALMKIEDLFIDGTDVCADREQMGLIARNALEGAK